MLESYYTDEVSETMELLVAGVKSESVQTSAELTAAWLAATDEELELKAKGFLDPHSEEAARASAAAEQLPGGQARPRE